MPMLMRMLVALMTLEMLLVLLELQLLVLLELVLLDLASLELQLLLTLDAHVELAPELRPRAPGTANATAASGQQ
jgi:hypothetical protein